MRLVICSRCSGVEVRIFTLYRAKYDRVFGEMGGELRVKSL